MKPAARTDRQPMRTAPRDGSLVRVAVRASEQGPAEFDVVRWAQSARSGEGGWISSDSDPDARIIYAEGELAYWVPLPSQVPAGHNDGGARPESGEADEGDGSAI